MLEVKEYELQALPGFVAENTTLCTKVSRWRSSVEMLGRYRGLWVMRTQCVCDLRAVSEMVNTDFEALR